MAVIIVITLIDFNYNLINFEVEAFSTSTSGMKIHCMLSDYFFTYKKDTHALNEFEWLLRVPQEVKWQIFFLVLYIFIHLNVQC